MTINIQICPQFRRQMKSKQMTTISMTKLEPWKTKSNTNKSYCPESFPLGQYGQLHRQMILESITPSPSKVTEEFCRRIISWRSRQSFANNGWRKASANMDNRVLLPTASTNSRKRSMCLRGTRPDSASNFTRITFVHMATDVNSSTPKK